MSRKQALDQFYASLCHTKFGEYAYKEPQELKCSICLIDLVDSDDITVLSCGNKHYFHSDCAKKWLE